MTKAKRPEYNRFLLIALLLVTGFARFATAAEPLPFLGPIPVQYVDAAGELSLDLHRFYEPAEKGEPFKIESVSGCVVSFDAAAFKLLVRVPENGAGIVDMPFSVGGKIHSVLTIAIRPAGGHAFSSIAGPQLFASHLETGTLDCGLVSGREPIATLSAVLELPDGSARSLDAKQERDRIRVALADAPPEAWVRIIVADKSGAVSNVLRFPLDAGKKFHWQDAVMYFPMTDRFLNGDKSNDKPADDPKVKPPANFHGGDWAGITEKIQSGYFDKIGINTLWVGPLNRNPGVAWQEAPEPRRWYTGYHGYWPVSATEVDPHWGSPGDLKKMIAAAHAHGMKVVADMVLHHVHTDHPWWKEHRDWFGSFELPDGTKNLRIWEAQQYTTWFDSFLPTFNWANEEAVSALIANAAWWAKEYSLDGFRLDAVKHIPLDFWWKFRRGLRVQVERPAGHPLYLVGESFLDPAGINAYVGPNMLDGQFNFPLYDAIQSAFGTGQGALASLDSGVSSTEQVYGKEALMSSLIGNHDKGRFLAYADGDLPDAKIKKEEEVGWEKPPKVDQPESYQKLELAQTFLLTNDGVPMIYYGDEFGMTGAGDPDNRRDMRFGKALSKPETVVLENFARLGKIRRDHPALRYGSRRVLQVEGDGYAYIRRHLDDTVVCLFNRGAKPMKASFKVAPEMEDGTYQNILNGSKIEVAEGLLKLEIPSRSEAVISR